jgi:hypothetical protein
MPREQISSGAITIKDDVMKMLISLVVIIISQYMLLSKHYIIHYIHTIHVPVCTLSMYSFYQSDTAKLDKNKYRTLVL